MVHKAQVYFQPFLFQFSFGVAQELPDSALRNCSNQSWQAWGGPYGCQELNSRSVLGWLSARLSVLLRRPYFILFMVVDSNISLPFPDCFLMLLQNQIKNKVAEMNLLFFLPCFLFSNSETINGDWNGCLPRPQQRHALCAWFCCKH